MRDEQLSGIDEGDEVKARRMRKNDENSLK